MAAANPALRWLVDPGGAIPAEIQQELLAELLESPGAVIAGIVAILVLNAAALVLHCGEVFVWLLAANVIISVLRTVVVWRYERARGRPGLQMLDAYLISGILWAAVPGAIALFALRSGIAPLQVLAATAVMSPMAPICARNYAAPRYAMLLICLLELPFVAGAMLARDHWLLLLLPLTPAFLYAIWRIIWRFQTMAAETLRARHASQHQARHDPLTGLLNRSGALAALGTGAAAEPLPLRLTLFYLDLDGFKQVNDGFGHGVGDLLLQAVAARLKAGARAGDIVARMGGDEFVLLAPDMPPADAEAFAARLIRLIKAPYELPCAGRVCVGVSVGFACAPDDSTTMAELYRLADAALYEVKAGGKGTQRRTGAPLLPSAA